MLLMSLWLPILLAAVAVFLVSAILHMVFKYHNGDFAALPDEDGVMSALRPFQLAPGEYTMPHCTDQSQMKDPQYLEKLNQGPVGILPHPNTLQCANSSMFLTVCSWASSRLHRGRLAPAEPSILS